MNGICGNNKAGHKAVGLVHHGSWTSARLSALDFSVVRYVGRRGCSPCPTLICVRPSAYVRILLSALMASLLFAGCCSTPDVQTAPPVQTSIETLETLTKGVVLIRVEGSVLYYRKKCESCGFIDSEIVGTGFPDAPMTCIVAFSCPQCEKTTDGFIKRFYANSVHLNK